MGSNNGATLVLRTGRGVGGYGDGIDSSSRLTEAYARLQSHSASLAPPCRDSLGVVRTSLLHWGLVRATPKRQTLHHLAVKLERDNECTTVVAG